MAQARTFGQIGSWTAALALLVSIALLLGTAYAPADAAAPRPAVAATPSILNIDPSATVGARAVYAATDAQRAALADLQTTAVNSIVAENGLVDSSAVLGWAREDVKARMFELLLSNFAKPATDRTADEALDYSWMQDVLRRTAVAEASNAVAEYNKFSGGAQYTQQGVANPNAPVTYGPDGSGYCTYHAPGPYDASYQGRSNYECFHPCESAFGCNPPYPTLDQLQAWGNYDNDQSVSTDANHSADLRETATLLSAGASFVAAGVAAQALLSLAPVLSGTALQLAVLPYAGKAIFDLGLTGEYLAAAWSPGFAAAAGVAGVAAVAIVAITLIVLRSIQLNDELSLPGQLDQAVTNAQTWQPDLGALTTTDGGIWSQALLPVFVAATEPEPALLGCDPSSSPDPRHCVNPTSPCCASTQNFEITPAGDPFGHPSSTIDSRDWSDQRTQSSTVSYNWFIHQVTDTQGRSATIQSLHWRYVDWAGKHWTATIRQAADGPHLFSVLDPTDWPDGAQSEPCTTAGTCRDSTSVDYVDASGGHSTVRLIGNPPLSTDDHYALDPTVSSTLTVPAPGVLANDTEPQGEPLIAQLSSAPQHGELYLHADGSFVYVPDPGYTGRDSFDYTAVNTDHERSTPSTVTLSVGVPPVAVDDRYTTPPDTDLTVSAPGVEGNDTIPEPAGSTVCDLTEPAHGHLEGAATLPGGIRVCGLHADGSFTYDPDPGFDGADSFTYAVTAANGQVSNIATVTITIVSPATLPQITIDAPVDGATYSLGDIVPAYYVCSSPQTILLCIGDAPAGAPLDTFQPGAHSFTVTALDSNYLSATRTVHYTVADTTAPTIEIAVPAPGAVYRAGQTVLADYSCADFELVSCTSAVALQSPLDTAKVGAKSFTITGTDAAGNKTHAIARYRVIAGPPAVVLATAGSGQHTVPGTTFAGRMRATVQDREGNPVPRYGVGCAVTSGSAVFGNGAASAVVFTDLSGVAQCPNLRAGANPGPVVVTVSAGPVGGANAAVYLATVTAPGTARADLGVTIASADAVSVQHPIRGLVTVANAGPAATGRLQVALHLPHSIVAIRGNGQRYRSTVVFTGASLAPGAQKTFVIVVRATSDRAGAGTLQARALATTMDPRYTDNVTTRQVTID